MAFSMTLEQHCVYDVCDAVGSIEMVRTWHLSAGGGLAGDVPFS